MLLMVAPVLLSAQSVEVQLASPQSGAPAGKDTDAPQDWACPMDPDVRSGKPGICPRCGMKLVLNVPERVEYRLVISHAPAALRPEEPVILTLRVLDPRTGVPVTHFELVHERLMHLFLVSENLQFFLHDHPALREDGSFQIHLRLPFSGMYRLLADFYPKGSVPQLALETLFAMGRSAPARLVTSLEPSASENLTATLRMEPEQPLAGLETRLFYSLSPSTGLEPYLGAWGHMLVVSEDLIELLHVHPFLADGGATEQFNVIFPRAGLYRIWTQFQRQGVVNTVAFTVPVKAL
jgi:hypothetical protein